MYLLYLSDTGVTTTDILTAYVQSIQALRVLDPSCVILEIVTEPVKQYLRSDITRKFDHMLMLYVVTDFLFNDTYMYYVLLWA